MSSRKTKRQNSLPVNRRSRLRRSSSNSNSRSDIESDSSCFSTQFVFEDLESELLPASFNRINRHDDSSDQSTSSSSSSSDIGSVVAIQQALSVLGSSSQAAKERRGNSRQSRGAISKDKRKSTISDMSLSSQPSTSKAVFSTSDETTTLDLTMDSVKESDDCTLYEVKTLWQDSYKQFLQFYKDNILCDVTIFVGDRSIPCHRVVLASISLYFKTMFTSEMAESFQQSVTIKDIEESALQQLIDFAYTSKIKLSVENVQSLLYASSVLQVEDVAHACGEFMKSHLDPSNCIGIRNFAEQHGRIELMERTDQYIRDNFLDVVKSEEFSAMTASYLEVIVSSSDVNVDNEKDVYESVMTWVRQNVAERKRYLPLLIGQVKLPLLDPTYLMDKVATDELIKGNFECRDFLDEAKDFQLSLAHVVPSRKLSERLRPRKSCAGVVFCVGGRGASGDPFKSIECYDLRKNLWFQVADMSCRRRHVGVVSVNGLLYAVGGHDGTDHLSSAEVFDPCKNKWRQIASMSTLRRGIALAHLGGPIYAVGGLDDATCFNNVERYDIASDSWTSVQAMHKPRGGVAVASLKGFLYAIGGNDGAASLDTCERYDPHLNKWTMVSPMTKRRAGAGVAVLNGYLYVIGGFDDNAPLDCVERYNPEEDRWENVTSMSCCRGGVGVASLAGCIYAVGGHDGANYLKSVESYDVITNSWELVSTIETRRAGAGVAVVDCNISQLKDITKCTLAISEDDSLLTRDDSLAGRL